MSAWAAGRRVATPAPDLLPWTPQRVPVQKRVLDKFWPIRLTAISERRNVARLTTSALGRSPVSYDPAGPLEPGTRIDRSTSFGLNP
jgi:hypothetical protein